MGHHVPAAEGPSDPTGVVLSDEETKVCEGWGTTSRPPKARCLQPAFEGSMGLSMDLLKGDSYPGKTWFLRKQRYFSLLLDITYLKKPAIGVQLYM